MLVPYNLRILRTVEVAPCERPGGVPATSMGMHVSVYETCFIAIRLHTSTNLYIYIYTHTYIYLYLSVCLYIRIHDICEYMNKCVHFQDLFTGRFKHFTYIHKCIGIKK